MRTMKFIVSCVSALVLSMPVLAEDMPVFQLVAKGGRFSPMVIEVPAGKRFKIEITNEGPGAIEFESKDLKQEKVLAPGAKSSVVINSLKTGTYKFVDEYHEATAQGTIVAK